MRDFGFNALFLRKLINYTIRLKEVDVAITMVVKGIEKDLAGLPRALVFNTYGHGGF